MPLSSEREGRLTASNHAIPLGHGYQSPQAFWRRWHGMEEQRVSAAMAAGAEHEADAISAYEALVGDITTDHQEWIAWEDWCGATLDARTELGILECKVPVEMYGSPPVKHWIQIQSQLVIADEGVGDLCAWSPSEVRIWRTRKDPEYWVKYSGVLKGYFDCLKNGLEPKRGQFKKADLNPVWERVV